LTLLMTGLASIEIDLYPKTIDKQIVRHLTRHPSMSYQQQHT
jgi:hypothetical protein